ncbi:hypothetical protein HK096_000886, partial [Nowakowskiella sp. JEL0078]
MGYNTLDMTDNLFIAFWFLPFGIASLSHAIMSTSILIREKNNSRSAFSPRWKPKFGFLSLSIGEVFVMFVLLICNLIWWIVPVYNRISFRPSNIGDHLENHALTQEGWIWDKIFGWAGT